VAIERCRRVSAKVRAPRAATLAPVCKWLTYLGASGRLRWVAQSGRGGRPPGRRPQPSLAVERHPNVALARRDVTVPELARHLLVALIEALAVVRELAASHLGPEAEPDLPEPVGVGERLTGGADEVGLAAAENALGLLE